MIFVVIDVIRVTRVIRRLWLVGRVTFALGLTSNTCNMILVVTRVIRVTRWRASRAEGWLGLTCNMLLVVIRVTRVTRWLGLVGLVGWQVGRATFVGSDTAVTTFVTASALAMC